MGELIIMDYTQSAREIFYRDIYASKTTGIIIEEADIGYAKCVMEILPKHKNSVGDVMGGAIFTLADFTFAVAANAGNPRTVSLSVQINYLSLTKGSSLIAEATCIKPGKSICLFAVTVKDDLDNDVAYVTATGFRK